MARQQTRQADFEIDVAHTCSLPACFAMLPSLATPEALIFTARDEDGRLAGAGGLNWKSWNDPPGFPAWIYVLPDCRRRGIGRALAERLKKAVVDETMTALWSIEPLEAGSAAAQFASGCGLEAARTQLFFDVDAVVFLQMIEEIVARLKRRGRIPANAALTDIDAVPPAEIARLVSAGLRTSPPRIYEMLHRARNTDPAKAPIDRDRSFALVYDGALAGVLLSRRQRDGLNSSIVCNVVDPQWRAGWANALLLQATTRRGVADGCQRFKFDCGDDVRDTIGLARRSGADHVRTAEFYRYAASATPPV